MIRSIFFKEWLKTRIVVVLSLLFSLCLCGYLLLDAHRLIATHGMMPVWDTLMTRDTLLLEWLEYVPVLVGILLGCAQMLPEILQKRIKLTLHLPVPAWQSVGAMTLYGVLFMLVLMATNLGLCAGVMAAWFPREILHHIFLTVLVWYVAGVQAYLFSVWIVLEPTWGRRILNLLFAGVCLRMFFVSIMPETYNAFLPILIAFTILFVALPMLSIARFQDGKGL